MNSILMAALCLIIASGCSDETKKPDASVDQGADASKADQGQLDGPVADSPAADTGQADQNQAGDLALADAAPLSDGNLSAMCTTLVKLCQLSATWPQYIKPFTVANCVKVTNCVDKQYTGACRAKFHDMVTCAGKITKGVNCDTKCAAEISYLTSNCSCPSACGVPCP